MFASQAQVVVDGAGTLWVPILLVAIAIVAFWRMAIRIILFAMIVMTLFGVIAFASFVHRM